MDKKTAKDIEETTNVKFFRAFIQKDSINLTERTCRFTFTSDKLDRDNERLTMDAISDAIPAFSSNPVFLACHLHRLADGHSPVIGSWLPDTFKVTKHTAEMTAKFATTPLAEEYWNLYSNGHQKAVSIGFVARVWGDTQDEKLGWIRTFTKIDLIEISAVPVGANREALAKAMKDLFGDIDSKSVSDFGEKIKALTNQLTKLEENIEIKFDELKTLMISDPDGLANHLLGDDFERPDPADNNKNAELLDRILKAIENAKKE